MKALNTYLLGQSKVVGTLTVANGSKELFFLLWSHKVIDGYNTRQEMNGFGFKDIFRQSIKILGWRKKSTDTNAKAKSATKFLLTHHFGLTKTNTLYLMFMLRNSKKTLPVKKKFSSQIYTFLN